MGTLVIAAFCCFANHFYARRITQNFQELLDVMTEKLESRFRADDSMSLQEMMNKWLNNFEGEDADEKRTGEAGIPDESDSSDPELDDEYIDPVALQYRNTLLQSAAYQRLLASLRQEMVLETPDSLFVTALQHKVMSIHSKRVSRRRAPSPCNIDIPSSVGSHRVRQRAGVHTKSW
jgi:hypothetical protein